MSNFGKSFWHFTTVETYLVAQGLVAISNAGARAEDEKVESWANIFMVRTYVFSINRGLFSTNAIGVLAPAILKLSYLAPTF